VEYARLRLRGVYAIIAGATLLFVAPLYHAAALGSAYDAATNAITRSLNFIPYLAWLTGNLGADQGSRVIQTLPLLIALALPGPLSAWLWAHRNPWRLTTLIAGWTGFAAFVLAGVIGFVTSASAADSYRAATSDAAHLAIASAFAQNYALQSLIGRGVGGIALGVFLALVSLRIITSSRLPRWTAYVGWLVAALEAANGIVFLINPLNLQAPTTSLTSPALAVWLLVIGLALWQARPDLLSQPSQQDGAAEGDDGAPVPSDDQVS
jgi:hypothetical protein